MSTPRKPVTITVNTVPVRVTEEVAEAWNLLRRAAGLRAKIQDDFARRFAEQADREFQPSPQEDDEDADPG